MIELLSQTEAERQGINPRRIQCITPYLNPAHVLSPPREWLEALIRGDYGWHFFRLRYKNLLRNRFRAEPERFHSLLDASADEQTLYLTCHCLTGHCHRDIAREYLELLRERLAARQVEFAAPLAGPSLPGAGTAQAPPAILPPTYLPPEVSQALYR